MNQKTPKKAHEMTTEEAMQHLFHPKVVERVKHEIRENEKRGEKKSTIEDDDTSK